MREGWPVRLVEYRPIGLAGGTEAGIDDQREGELLQRLLTAIAGAISRSGRFAKLSCIVEWWSAS